MIGCSPLSGSVEMKCVRLMLKPAECNRYRSSYTLPCCDSVVINCLKASGGREREICVFVREEASSAVLRLFEDI